MFLWTVSGTEDRKESPLKGDHRHIQSNSCGTHTTYYIFPGGFWPEIVSKKRLYGIGGLKAEKKS